MDPSALIIWQDSDLLVINKPAGLCTLPDGYNSDLPHVKSLLEASYGCLWIVHRLDRDTSGALLLARNAAAHRALNMQFDSQCVKKEYWALVLGNPSWHEQLVSLPLLADGDRRHRTVVDLQDGKEAYTRFEVIRQLSGCCLLKAQPKTGRTHQIRAHLKAIGFPIAADALYGGGRQFLAFKRPALHAWSIEITHPRLGTRIRWEAPNPGDFVESLGAC